MGAHEENTMIPGEIFCADGEIVLRANGIMKRPSDRDSRYNVKTPG